MSTDPGVRASRTQIERSAETRARVLRATVDCLVDEGYARTTTKLVAERAGVSRGALLHQFPTRFELVVEAIEHLAERQLAAARQKMEHRAQSGNRLEAYLDILWEDFSEPLFFAAMELWIAARTDPALLAKLLDVERNVGQEIRVFVEDLGHEAAAGRRFADFIELTLHLLRGMALQRILREDDVERHRVFEFWRELVVRELQNGSDG